MFFSIFHSKHDLLLNFWLIIRLDDIDEPSDRNTVEAGSGGKTDQSLSDERSEQQGGATDSISTEDNGKISAESADATKEDIKIKSSEPSPNLDEDITQESKAPSSEIPIRSGPIPIPPSIPPREDNFNIKPLIEQKVCVLQRYEFHLLQM